MREKRKAFISQDCYAKRAESTSIFRLASDHANEERFVYANKAIGLAVSNILPKQAI